MNPNLDRSVIYESIPGEKLDKVAIRLEKEPPLLSEGYIVDDCKKAITLVGGEFIHLDREYVGVINTKANLVPINFSIVSIGTFNRSLVCPADIFKTAILSGAVNIIMIHNHPSGDVFPSDIDKSITKKIVFLGELIGIRVLDHIIIGGNNTENYYSFNEDDLIDYYRNHMDFDLSSVWFDNVAEKHNEFKEIMAR